MTVPFRATADDHARLPSWADTLAAHSEILRPYGGIVDHHVARALSAWRLGDTRAEMEAWRTVHHLLDALEREFPEFAPPSDPVVDLARAFLGSDQCPN